VVRGMAHRRIGIGSPPSQDGRAVDDEVAPADEASIPGQPHEHDEQALARRSARLRRAPALLGGTGHKGMPVPVGRQATGTRQRGPRHQPIMQVLLRSAPQRAQQRQQQKRFLAVTPGAPAGPGGQRWWAPTLTQAYGQAAQRQQMQAGDEHERIEVQSGATGALAPAICWGRDWSRTCKGGRNHGLISLGRERAAPGDQPILFLQLCNALRLFLIFMCHT
jgi:hypothetical protein